LELEKISWLWLLVPVVLLVAFWMWQYRQQWLALKSTFGPDMLTRLIPGFSYRFQQTRHLFLLFGLFLLVLALVNPRFGGERTGVDVEVVNVVIAMDMSYSMMAGDRTPNRLEVARQNTIQLIDELRGNYFAFMPFAGVARLEVPITTDLDAIKGNIRAAEAGMMPVQGTSFAAMLDEAYNYLQQLGSGVLVVLTDGEDHGPDFHGSLGQMKQGNFPVFGILIGDEQGAPIPSTDRDSRQFRRDAEGNQIITKMERQPMGELSKETNGFLVVNPGPNEVQSLAERIRGFREGGIAQGTYRTYFNLYPWLLTVGFLSLLLYWLLPNFYSDKKVV